MVSFADEVEIFEEDTTTKQLGKPQTSFSAPTKRGIEHGLIPNVKQENGKEMVTYHLGMLKVCTVYL